MAVMGFSKDFEEGLMFHFQNDRSDRNLQYGDSAKVGGRGKGKKEASKVLPSLPKQKGKSNHLIAV